MAGLIGPVGTNPTLWRESARLAGLPPLELPESILVVAAHPDDEVLGAGALITTVARRSPVHVIVLTDGEASHPDSSTVTVEQMAKLRREESILALAALGVRLPPHHYDLGDGRLADREHRAVELIADTIMVTDPELVLAPWRHDGHPDHAAAGRATALACAATDARLMEYPVWFWHWGAPDDDRAPWDRALGFPVDAAARAQKNTALAQYVSQTQDLSEQIADRAVVPETLLASVTGTHEVFFA